MLRTIQLCLQDEGQPTLRFKSSAERIDIKGNFGGA
jgi:hypothetical protein